MENNEVEIGVRLTICEYNLIEVTKRLDSIDKKLSQMTKISNMGLGIWKAIFLTGCLLSIFLGITKIRGD